MPALRHRCGCRCTCEPPPDPSAACAPLPTHPAAEQGLGNNEDANTPQLVPLPEGEQVEQCVSGWKHTVVVAQSGKVYSWGRWVLPHTRHRMCVGQELVLLGCLRVDQEPCHGGHAPLGIQ